MKVVILAGGLGTRLSELTGDIPKPMVDIGGQPIIWHIMNIYAAQGFDDFIIALGYKSHVIKNYFLNYYSNNSDFKIDLSTGTIEYIKSNEINWKVTLVDTGVDTMTGGRLKRLQPYLKETFMLTYGDGVADVDVSALINLHKTSGKLVTLTTIHPTSKYGKLDIDEFGRVLSFIEKPEFGGDWINGGYFVIEPEFLSYIDGDSTILESYPLERACELGQLSAYKHTGFWHCMDTLRDRNYLNSLWDQNKATWKIWS
jgi:glucose-1-phosphate cytidylyltransferase